METRSREISKDEWKRFLDQMSRHYKGRAVNLEWKQGAEGARKLARNTPFIGCTLEERPPDLAETIDVIAEGAEGELFTHVIEMPKRLWIRQEANGGDNAIGIEARDGSTLVIEFAADSPRFSEDEIP